MKGKRLLWLLVFVLIVIVAATVIAIRLQSQRANERRRKIEHVSQAVGRTFIPDTSPARFSR